MKTFRVNDIFYSLQGEGHNTGRAAVFIRFAGCNLRCSFCDTEFDTYREMTADDILSTITSLLAEEGGSQLSPITHHPARPKDACYQRDARTPNTLLVLTGGEPTLQVDEAFVELLHAHGYEVAMESNGTRPAPSNLDWLTVSPKGKSLASFNESGKQPDEIKIVFESEDSLNAILTSIPPSLGALGACDALLAKNGKGVGYLQPCDTGDPERNALITEACIRYIKQHHQWRLSLQTHKLIGFK